MTADEINSDDKMNGKGSHDRITGNVVADVEKDAKFSYWIVLVAAVVVVAVVWYRKKIVLKSK